LPRLGFFAGDEARIPYDFHEILACIAPRPLLIIAPTWDQYVSCTDVHNCVEEVKKLYNIFSLNDKVTFYTPKDYNRFSPEMKEYMINWLKKK
jgi:hypothetical protein